jgi:hypothetical protein
MKIVYAQSGDDLQQIKYYGFDTVCGYFTKAELDLMLILGLKCIYNGGMIAGFRLYQHDAICAYYVYDEPDYNKVSIAAQEITINEYRTLTDKPLAIACVEQTKQLCSPNYDWYMLDIYYLSELGKFGKLINYLNIAFSTHAVMALYPGKKILPIIGLYDDITEFKYSEEAVRFGRKFRSYFRNELDQAIFIWKGNKTTYWGIIDRTEYEYAATFFNCRLEPDKCWWMTSKVWMGIAHTVIFARKLIKDAWITKINSWLPANLKMKL